MDDLAPVLAARPPFAPDQAHPAAGSWLIEPNRPDAVRTSPFPHLCVDACLASDLYAELDAGFPAMERFAPDAARLDNRVLRIGSSRVLDEPGYSSAWRELVSDHTSPAFWQRIVGQFGPEIRKRLPGLEARMGKPLETLRAVRFGSGVRGDVTLECQPVINTPSSGRAHSVRGPHVDRRHKLWSGLFYLRLDPDTSTGGDLHLYAAGRERRFDGCSTTSDNECRDARIPYAANRFVGFVNSPISVHAVGPRGYAPWPRRYVNLYAITDVDLFDLPQMGRLRRRWFRLFEWNKSR